jgi:exonuclease V gamma subunit
VLQLRIPEECAPLDEREPQELGHLDRYGFEQTLTQRALGSTAALRTRGRASHGKLPPGYVGDSISHHVQPLHELAAEIREHISGDPPTAHRRSGAQTWRVTGTLRGIYPTAMLRHRTAALKPKDLLQAWIAHLVFQHCRAAICRARRCSSGS